MPVFKQLSDLLESFDNSETAIDEDTIFGAIQAISGDSNFASAEEFAKWTAEGYAFGLVLQRDGRSDPWGCAFGPRIYLSSAVGGPPMYRPDIAFIRAQDVHYWDSRSQSVKHPILVARYSDLVWTFSKRFSLSTGIDAALRAIDAYIEASKRDFVRTNRSVGYAERALDLSLSIRDAGWTKKENAVSALFDLYQRLSDAGEADLWPFLFDKVYENKNVPLSADREKLLIDALEQMLTRYSDTETATCPDMFKSQAAGERLIAHYKSLGAQSQIQRVTSAYGAMFEHCAEAAPPLRAMGLLDAIRIAYVEAKLPADATRVQIASKKAGIRAGKDIPRKAMTFELPEWVRKGFEDFLRGLGEVDLPAALDEVAKAFCPRADDASVLLKDMKQSAPLTSIIPIASMGEGQVTARAGSVEGDLEGRMAFQLAEMIDHMEPALHGSFARIRAAYGPSAADIVAHLYQSSAFDEERRPLLQAGVEAYLTGDFLKAIHILIPQIEYALRRLLTLLGIPANKPRRAPVGTMQEKSLNDILDDPSLWAVLEDDLRNYLSIFLNDPRGHNVRNRVAHGLLGIEMFSEPLAERVMHVLLCLSMARRQEPEQP